MPTSNFVETPSLRIHYLQEGKGTPEGDPVIMLHGFPQTSYMWRHQIPLQAAEHAVYAPDTRGYGKTDKPRIRLTRDILARDVIEFMDALGLERAQLVAHDWGGLIAFKAVVDYPDRFSKLALFDTLTSVWINWGIHGYWFKCEPQAEEFYEKHHEAFIRSVFGGEDGGYGGPPYSPWAAVEGSEGSESLSDFDPTKHWTREDVDHYAEAFSDPDCWFHAIEYYRHCLPFHIEREDANAPGGLRFEFLSSPKVAEMWNHPGLLFSHPDYARFMTFAPEDRHKTYPGPTLYVFSPFLVPQAFENGIPPDDYIPSGNPYAESFPRHFPDLRTRGVQSGHFIPEEAPERTNELLTDFLAGRI
ncbi:MAG: alpha/beta hydrolase [Myxococcales bacterium]|nr:alpha/beta hydrolase [Myxococcales bacterium]